jgi:hypothetical protein
LLITFSYCYDSFCTRDNVRKIFRRGKNFLTILTEKHIDAFLRFSPGITWYHDRTYVGVGLSVGLGKKLKKDGWCEPERFLQTTEAAEAKRESSRDGKSRGALSHLPRLYQVLIDDLQFYILRSRPSRALERVSKIGDLKILI